MLDPLIVLRAVHFGATAIIAGVLFFHVAIARPALAARAKDFFRQCRWLLATALMLALLSGALWPILLTSRIADAPIAQVFGDGTLRSLLTETRFGHVWIARAAFAVVIALVIVYRRGPWLGCAAAFLMLGSLALVGHAGARPDAIGWLQIAADMLHLLAAGFWLGGLIALALVLTRFRSGEANAAASSAIISRFSLFGMIAVGALLVTGAINTWLLTDSITGLPETDYGRLLLVKIVLFVAMVAFACINRWYWSPRLPAQQAIAVIRRNAVAELGLGLMVIGIVGALGTLPPPLHRHAHSTEQLPEAAFVHIHDVKAMADVTVLPGRPGPSEIWLQLMKEDFTPLPARAVRVRLFHPDQESFEAEARSGRVGLWRVPGIALPVGGVWKIVVEVQTDTERISLDAPFVLGSAQKQ